MIRSAFTMIELIFAIVIIAITVVSLPMMVQVNQRGIESNIAQEAIFAASAKLMQATTFPWDEHSIDLNGSSPLAKVVDFPGNSYPRVSYNPIDSNNSYRIGHIRQNGHRKFHPLAFADANITALGDNEPDIVGLDEISGTEEFLSNSGSATGYKKKYESVTLVRYIADSGNPYVLRQSGAATPTNMKMISVTIQDADNHTPVAVLYSYAANIGEVDFASRIY